MIALAAVGIGAVASLAGIGLAAILGKKEYLWVASAHGGALASHRVSSASEAKTLQDNFAKSGRASILIRQAADGTLSSENFTPGVTLAPEAKKAMKEKWESKPIRLMPGAARGARGIVTMRRSMSNPGGAKDLSVPELMTNVTQHPDELAPRAEAIRAKEGPYPESPRFYLTPSSHEYKTLVETHVLPATYQPHQFFNAETKDLVHFQK